MNVSLTPELEKVVNAKVRSGMYNSASEVVREGLRLLQQRDEMREHKLAALRGELAKGVDDLEVGRTKSGSKMMEAARSRLPSSAKKNS